MTKYNTHKRQAAIALLMQIVGQRPGEPIFSDRDSEVLYDMLDKQNFLWDEKQQGWRMRKPGTRGKRKAKAILRHEVMLIRIMAQRGTLVNQLEDFKLAMEVLGYEVIGTSEILANRGQKFYRVYLKVKVS